MGLSQQDQEADENQQYVTRAEKVTLLPCMDEEVLKHPAGVEGQELQPGALSRKRRCPNRSNQELSSGAVRGEVEGDNLSEEGTRNESRNCTKESDQQTGNGVSPLPALKSNFSSRSSLELIVLFLKILLISGLFQQVYGKLRFCFNSQCDK